MPQVHGARSGEPLNRDTYAGARNRVRTGMPREGPRILSLARRVRTDRFTSWNINEILRVEREICAKVGEKIPHRSAAFGFAIEYVKILRQPVWTAPRRSWHAACSTRCQTIHGNDERPSSACVTLNNRIEIGEIRRSQRWEHLLQRPDCEVSRSSPPWGVSARGLPSLNR